MHTICSACGLVCVDLERGCIGSLLAHRETCNPRVARFYEPQMIEPNPTRIIEEKNRNRAYRERKKAAGFHQRSK